MGKPFSVNTTRFDPYKSFAFLVYLDTSTTPVAAASALPEPENPLPTWPGTATA